MADSISRASHVPFRCFRASFRCFRSSSGVMLLIGTMNGSPVSSSPSLAATGRSITAQRRGWREVQQLAAGSTRQANMQTVPLTMEVVPAARKADGCHRGYSSQLKHSRVGCDDGLGARRSQSTTAVWFVHSSNGSSIELASRECGDYMGACQSPLTQFRVFVKQLF